MKKNKILIIGPVSSQPTDVHAIARSLIFLEQDYVLDSIDPLSVIKELPHEEYYAQWQQYLSQKMTEYDGFFGFSFGGVILQHCFSLFEQQKKSIILFSTPTCADHVLQYRLNQVITLCIQNKLEEALTALYQWVVYPAKLQSTAWQINDRTDAIRRLIFGLTKVLKTDSAKQLHESTVPYLHFIGAKSQLVNTKNVLKFPSGDLVVVPEAGMRVLEHNGSYCQKRILDYLMPKRELYD